MSLWISEQRDCQWRMWAPTVTCFPKNKIKQNVKHWPGRQDTRQLVSQLCILLAVWIWIVSSPSGHYLPLCEGRWWVRGAQTIWGSQHDCHSFLLSAAARPGKAAFLASPPSPFHPTPAGGTASPHTHNPGWGRHAYPSSHRGWTQNEGWRLRCGGVRATCFLHLGSASF